VLKLEAEERIQAVPDLGVAIHALLYLQIIVRITQDACEKLNK
jgi:hypothetical protein